MGLARMGSEITLGNVSATFKATARQFTSIDCKHVDGGGGRK